MDLELEQDIILCYESAGQATICQEETQEAIVPDACPDILRIADVCAQAFISRWEAKSGQATVFGYVQANVLYIPENGHTVQKMELKLPFSACGDMNEVDAQSVLEVSVRVRGADGRMLNPRKILLRADIVAEITAYNRREYPVCTGAYQADGEKLCQKVTDVEHERIVGVPQRIFPMSEEIRLTGAQVPDVLTCRGESFCTECRVIGNKLIFKGKTDVVVLLRTEDGNLERRIETFPFSQILEAKGVGENGIGAVRLEMAELICRPAADDPFRLLLDTEILAQGQVRDRETVSLLTDLYSTTDYLQLERRQMHLSRPLEEQTVSQTLRDLLETEDVVRAVCDSRYELGTITAAREQDSVVLTARGHLTVMYLDEERQPRCIKKETEVSGRVHCPKQAQISCKCLCPGEIYAAACAGGIEVRLNLEFHVMVCVPEYMDMVCEAKPERSRGGEGVRPSVILRRPEDGETLWDIAKDCGTTKSRIMQANALQDEEIPGHRMLLIPSVR